MDLNNLNILITGASSGLGAEFARQLHAQGSSVVLVARRKEALERLASTFNTSRSGSALALCADLTTYEQKNAEVLGLSDIIEYIKNNKIDILINNAGRGSFGTFESLSIEEEESIIDLNIRASMRLTYAVIPQMKARRAGAILSISSIAGFQPLPYMATYSATKAFNLIHSMALRNELREFGVYVTTICPGPTDTEFAGVARVPGQFTGVGRDRVDEVVRQSIHALQANRPFVVPCFKSKLLSLGSRCLPLSLSTWLVGKMLKPSLQFKN